MSPFKEIIKNDVSGVFVNNDEFAYEHTLNGIPMDVIIDNNELVERGVKVMNAETDTLYRSRILVYVKAEQYGAKPKVGSIITLDGKKTYRVLECVDEDGVYSITMEANRS